jgi:hypothetical protein
MLYRIKTVTAVAMFAALAATSGAAIAGTPSESGAAPEFHPECHGACRKPTRATPLSSHWI